jgi:hypothetical protein
MVGAAACLPPERTLHKIRLEDSAHPSLASRLLRVKQGLRRGSNGAIFVVRGGTCAAAL